MKASEYQKLLRESAQADKEVERLKWEQTKVLDELSEALGFDSIAEAEAFVKKEQKEIANAEKELEKIRRRYERKYLERFNAEESG